MTRPKHHAPDIGSSTTRSAITRLLVLLAILGLLANSVHAAKNPFAKKPYQEGQRISIEGQVTDQQGRPLPDVPVVLEASRKAFSFSNIKRKKENPRTIHVKTDADGRYEVPWTWHPYYNHFELWTVVNVRTAFGTAQNRPLAYENVSKRVRKGTPVEVNMVVEDAQFLFALRDFEDALQTDSEREIFYLHGKPDRVDGDHQTQVAWWYFEIGRVYRFEQGDLAKTEEFDPVGSD